MKRKRKTIVQTKIVRAYSARAAPPWLNCHFVVKLKLTPLPPTGGTYLKASLGNQSHITKSKYKGGSGLEEVFNQWGRILSPSYQGIRARPLGAFWRQSWPRCDRLNQMSTRVNCNSIGHLASLWSFLCVLQSRWPPVRGQAQPHGLCSRKVSLESREGSWWLGAK